MPPRTRATASAVLDVAPLAAAPRRRVKVTPLEQEQQAKPTKEVDDDAKPTTRSTRNKKAEAGPTEEPKPKIIRSKATTVSKASSTTRPKTRDRSKKAGELVLEPESGVEAPIAKGAEKPKRATRSTRATATTVSSEAKEKPTTRAPRSTRTTNKQKAAVKTASEEKTVIEDHKPATKTGHKKKVTFQDLVEDDKENHPVLIRDANKTMSTKANKASQKTTGIRAKPVRKPAVATRGSKRSQDQLSDSEEEEPKRKIQRVLTPKKITQIARAATPEADSEDELNGGKTPIRDLSMSPKRPQTHFTAEAVSKALAPVKSLDFTQSLLPQSAKDTDAGSMSALTSPARRPPVSPAKLFSHSKMQSPGKGPNEDTASLASPARRRLASPAKLLFPMAPRNEHRANVAHGSGNLFQSPKRSAALDAARIFPHSSVKNRKTELSKSPFFSSSAKRAALFSPMKKVATPKVDEDVSEIESLEQLELNNIEITELLAEPAEICISSHQRASVSPRRTHKLSADELALDFEQSILPVGSPFKLTKSPIHLDQPAEQPIKEPAPILASSEMGDQPADAMSSVQSTPRARSHGESTCVSLKALETDHESVTHDLELQAEATEDGDETVVLFPVAEATTPRSIVASYHGNDDSIDELAPSPREDVIAQFVRTPGTPASLAEHELTNMIPSPAAEGTTSAVKEIEEGEVEAELASSTRLDENELTFMGGMPMARITPKTKNTCKARPSTASLLENELTVMGESFEISQTASSPTAAEENEPTRVAGNASLGKVVSPVSVAEHELTMMGGTPKAASFLKDSSPISLQENELEMMAGTPKARITPKASIRRLTHFPASVYENELTIMGGTPKANIPVTAAEMSPESPAILQENELTMMAAEFTPGQITKETDAQDADKCQSSTVMQHVVAQRSPASVVEHELTIMGTTSAGKEKEDELEATLAATLTQPATTPDMPIPRKFNLHTVVSKVPLKPEGQESPLKLQMKKRKRPLSLGGQPDFDSVEEAIMPAKSARTAQLPHPVSARVTPVASPAGTSAQRTPATKPSTVKSARRIFSTPSSRTPLTPVAGDKFLSGVLAYVDVRTSEGADASAIYIDLLINLGARIVKEWKDSITHIVFKDGNTKILERARLSDADIKIVGVSWPLDCDAQKTWLDEAEYLLNLSPTDHVLNSVTKSAKRKSMEPSTLICDGDGSIKRSRSRSRASIASRRSSVKPLADATARASVDADVISTMTTPTYNTAKKQADVERNSLTAAWKSINATQNLGEDTPARRTLELLQKSYELENTWDDSLSAGSEDQENTPQVPLRLADQDDDTEVTETGLTPAPYRVAQQVGSAPAKTTNVGMTSYRERVEEMERREMRDNAFGTNKGARGKQGKRMTVFGSAFEPVRGSPLRD